MSPGDDSGVGGCDLTRAGPGGHFPNRTVRHITCFRDAFSGSN